MSQLDNKTKWVAIAGDDDIYSTGGVSFTNYERYFGNVTDKYVVIENRIIFIFLNTVNEGGPVSKERLDWMDHVIQNHTDLLVVLCLHHSLFEFPLFTDLSASNAGEIWNHITQHENVILTLSGHVHLSLVRIHSNQNNKVWALSTEALMGTGYIRLFDVYQDRIEVYAYSAWESKAYTGTLDRFTIRLNQLDDDADQDLWNDEVDIMPTHPFVPNGIIGSTAIAITIIIYWTRERMWRTRVLST
jgi:3',5'-cyclic AMP phosphodiesterase CpdA